MKFLITGITGFAGPHLANLLHAEGHEIYGLIRRTNGMETDIHDVVPDEVYNSITFLYADLCNYRSLRNVFENLARCLCLVIAMVVVLRQIKRQLYDRAVHTQEKENDDNEDNVDQRR